MREGEPSGTAIGAALLRAEHQDVDGAAVFRDPLARRILGDLPSRPELDGVRAMGWLRQFIAVRHRFAEDALAAAYDRGTRQAVVLGAGLDTLAYRSPWPDLRVWEVDHPSTGAWKQAQLAATGIEVPATVAYVGVDFERDRLLERLAAAGFDAAAPAFFLWLGVVPYLTRAAVIATLRTIGSLPGAEVVLDHTTPAGDSGDLAASAAGVGEPFTAGWAPEDLAATLRAAGFVDVEDLGRPEIRERYLGLPPDATQEQRPGGGHVVRARTA